MPEKFRDGSRQLNIDRFEIKLEGAESRNNKQ
jgi:hypothetical protein